MKIQYTVVGEIDTYSRDLTPKLLMVEGVEEPLQGNTFEKTFHCLTEDNTFNITTLIHDAYMKLKGTTGLVHQQIKIKPKFTILDLEIYKKTPEDYLKETDMWYEQFKTK